MSPEHSAALLSSIVNFLNLDSYKKDIWLWDLDWSKKSKKLKNIEVAIL